MTIADKKIDPNEQLKLRAVGEMHRALQELMVVICELSKSIEKSIMVFYNSLALFESSYTVASDLAKSLNGDEEPTDEHHQIDASDRENDGPVSN